MHSQIEFGNENHMITDDDLKKVSKYAADCSVATGKPPLDFVEQSLNLLGENTETNYQQCKEYLRKEQDKYRFVIN